MKSFSQSTLPTTFRVDPGILRKASRTRSKPLCTAPAPKNHRKLGRYQEMSRRLALAEGVAEEEARKLAELKARAQAEAVRLLSIAAGLCKTKVVEE